MQSEIFFHMPGKTKLFTHWCNDRETTKVIEPLKKKKDTCFHKCPEFIKNKLLKLFFVQLQRLAPRVASVRP